ncbi:hypothetical protein MHK_007222 [Candidatus Magnetomorum sp. HK-1]|nr:hypothetical protein MHK_007222 [Candidatus Magnetomorum sp. HK-1]
MGKAIILVFLMKDAKDAAIPPMQAKYTAWFWIIASIVCGLRDPLPIIPFNPCCNNKGDIRSKFLRQISTAANDGLIAAKAIANHR